MALKALYSSLVSGSRAQSPGARAHSAAGVDGQAVEPNIAPAALAGLYHPAYIAHVKRVAAQLAPLQIRVTRATPLSYALRLELSGPNGEGAIQFSHKANMDWTGCHGVGPSPTSHQAAACCALG